MILLVKEGKLNPLDVCKLEMTGKMSDLVHTKVEMVLGGHFEMEMDKDSVEILKKVVKEDVQKAIDSPCENNNEKPPCMIKRKADWDFI